MRSRVGPAVTTDLQPLEHAIGFARCEDLLGNAHGLDHATHADLAARLLACVGPDEAHAALAQEAHIRLRGRIGPHLAIHGRRDGDRCGRRQTKRGQQIIRETMCEPREEIGRRRRDDDLVGPASELDVAHRRLGCLVPQIRPHRLAGDGLEGQRRDEALGAGRHDDLHVTAALDQASDQIGALVRGDSARNAEEDFSGLPAHAAIIVVAREPGKRAGAYPHSS